MSAAITCSSCGSTEVRKLPTSAAFQLKGAGFHRNDYPNVDQRVGEDAEKRWEHIHRRTEVKEKMREKIDSNETIVRQDDGGYAVEKRDKVPPSAKDLHEKNSV